MRWGALIRDLLIVGAFVAVAALTWPLVLWRFLSLFALLLGGVLFLDWYRPRGGDWS